MSDEGRAAATGCAEMPAAVVLSYVDGRLHAAAQWSVEAHLPGCPACRAVLTGCTDPDRLARNRAVLLARTGLPESGAFGRALRRCGVPEHIIVLLAATPSLRRSWLIGVLLVLAVVVAAAQLVAAVEPQGLIAAAGDPGTVGWTGLMPFLALAPLLPLAAVAAAFSPELDPSHRLASAAPVSMVWLLCVRSLAVIAATIVPVAVAALALPGPWWLAVALLLPALAVCGAALALATLVSPPAAVIGVAASWMTVVIGLDVATRSSSAAFGPIAQLAAAGVLLGGVATVIMRRNKIDYGWMG